MNRRKRSATRISSNNNQTSRFFKIWVQQHLQAFFFSLGQLYRYPLSSLLTAAVIGIALALPAGFYLGLENARLVSSGWDNTVHITAFLKSEVDDNTAIALTQRLSEDAAFQKVRYITRELALEEYRRSSGYAEAIDALDENPLPALLLIQPQLDSMIDGHDDQLIKMLQALPEIETAQYDQQWIKRLNAIIIIVQRVVMVLAVFLALAVLLIIGNTIRMSIYNRREEIEIIKLFGATDAFIHRPFLYSGFWYGISGGVIAWALISLSLLLLKYPVSELANLYASTHQLIGLSGQDTLILLGCGVELGLIGSWISVKRHLAALDSSE
ncbi:MAG: permease-like cell division protein FtsX [Gammaproteobacteria bacterium]